MLKSLLALLLMSAAAAATAQDPGAIAQARCKEFNDAIVSKDISYFKKTAAPGFTWKSEGSVKDLSDTLSALKEFFRMVSAFRGCNSGVKSAKLSGKKLIVLVETTMTAHMVSMRHKSLRLVEKRTDRAIWLKTSSGWKIKSIESLSDRATMNGKHVGSPM